MLNLYEIFDMIYPSQSDESIILSKKVLVAEDTKFFQEVEKKYLESAGCVVRVVENGKEAYKLLEEESFDLLVSDLLMPEMNGLELIKRVRTNPKLRNIPAIAVSSMMSQSYIQQSLEYGYDAFVNKLNREVLLSSIYNVLKSSRT